jgi:hypothetical protein
LTIGGEIKGLGEDVMGVLTDPIGTLVGAGLTIVLDLVQPFDELLMMVSGDATEMQRQIDVLGQVEAALGALEGEMANAEEAGSAEMTWGLPGLCFAEVYAEGCTELANLTGLLGGTITRHADGLRQCADTYAQADADIAAEFDRLAAEIGA